MKPYNVVSALRPCSASIGLNEVTANSERQI